MTFPCADCGHSWDSHEEPWPLPSGFAPGMWCGWHPPEGGEPCRCEAYVDPLDKSADEARGQPNFGWF